MNRRQTKKAYKLALLAVVAPKQEVKKPERIEELIADCAGLAYKINISTDFFVWFQHTGHVNWIEARIAAKKDEFTRLYDAQVSYVEREWRTKAEILQNIEAIRDKFEYVLDHNEIPKEA